MIYSQRDSRWASVKLGSSDLDIGNYGCGVSCLAMMLSRFVGMEETPMSVAEKIGFVKGFTQNGWIIWSKVSEAFPEADFLGRDYVVADFNTSLITSEVALTRAKKMLRIGQFPLLAVMLGSNNQKPNHWVLATKDIDGTLFVADPWTGDEVAFTGRYGSPHSQIFGLSRFFGPVATAPDMTLRTVSYKAHEMTKGRGIKTYSKEIFNDLVL